VCVPDHLGIFAPFPALAVAAQATNRVRLGTFVLNAAFYNPVLLARDAASTDQLSDGRLELGLGTGYAKAEFDAAGIPFPGPGARVDHLRHTVTELRRASPRRSPLRPSILLHRSCSPVTATACCGSPRGKPTSSGSRVSRSPLPGRFSVLPRSWPSGSSSCARRRVSGPTNWSSTCSCSGSW